MPNDDACLEFLFRFRFGHQEKCTDCNRDFHYYRRVPTRQCYQCSCGKQIFPRVGSAFNKSTLKLEQWFHAIYLMSTGTYNSVQMSSELGIEQATAWELMMRIRTFMKDDHTDKFVFAECDETWIGGEKQKEHEHGFINKFMVIGLLCPFTKQIRMELLPKKDEEHMRAFMDRHLLYHGTLYTDHYSIYGKLADSYQQWFTSSKVNKYRHPAWEFKHTNGIEGAWHILKHFISCHNMISERHSQLYLDEFMFRWNRTTRRKAFNDLLTRMCSQPQLAYPRYRNPILDR